MCVRSLALALAFASCNSMVWAQATNVCSITVTVLDPAGASVPAAQLQLRDLGTNEIRRAETQSNGAYSFINLSFGTYELTIRKDGF